MAQLLEPFAGSRSVELATAIRAEFGSLSRAFAAPRKHFLDVVSEFGRSAELLLAAKRIIDQSDHELIVGSHVKVTDPDMLAYLRQRLCHPSVERLMVIYCDSEDRYIHDEVASTGCRFHVTLEPSHLFRRALKHDAHAILLAHNHPSGDPTPSEDDICGTRALANAGVALNIRFIDHLIVTPGDVYSMRRGERL